MSAASIMIRLAVTLPAAPAPGRTESLQTAWLVLAALTLVLTLFLTVVAVVMVDRRRRRRRRPENERPDSGVDAWSEAGRRARSS